MTGHRASAQGAEEPDIVTGWERIGPECTCPNSEWPTHRHILDDNGVPIDPQPAQPVDVAAVLGEESIDLTPGVVWTDSQLAVVRQLVARIYNERRRVIEPFEKLAAEPQRLARFFHEAYERLAPLYGYETRRESAVPWEDVPENNRLLMTAVCAEVGQLIRSAAKVAGRAGSGEAGRG